MSRVRLSLLVAFVVACVTSGAAQNQSLVGVWKTDVTDSSRPLPQPWGRTFLILKDGSELEVRFEGNSTRIYKLDGQPVTTKETRSGATYETTTTAKRLNDRISIEMTTVVGGTTSGGATTTLVPQGAALVVKREFGSRGGQQIEATYKRVDKLDGSTSRR